MHVREYSQRNVRCGEVVQVSMLISVPVSNIATDTRAIDLRIAKYNEISTSQRRQRHISRITEDSQLQPSCDRRSYRMLMISSSGDVVHIIDQEMVQITSPV